VCRRCRNLSLLRPAHKASGQFASGRPVPISDNPRNDCRNIALGPHCPKLRANQPMITGNGCADRKVNGRQLSGAHFHAGSDREVALGVEMPSIIPCGGFRANFGHSCRLVHLERWHSFASASKQRVRRLLSGSEYGCDARPAHFKADKLKLRSLRKPAVLRLVKSVCPNERSSISWNEPFQEVHI
jgi:hypothetical protein